VSGGVGEGRSVGPVIAHAGERASVFTGRRQGGSITKRGPLGALIAVQRIAFCFHFGTPWLSPFFVVVVVVAWDHIAGPRSWV